MKEKFLKYIESGQLLDKSHGILVALSGGIDSVVLVHLLYETGFEFCIAHCNFQLRGKESDKDEVFVRSIGEKYNLKTFIKECNAEDYAKTNKISIQESARELRYDWFEQISIENNLDKILVAHHFDDNLETFFINFSRGSGLSGLKGIPVKNDKIIRPLMFASRKEIVSYAKENQLKFREDSSNASDKYLRNNLRHNLLPGFLEILGGSNETLRKSMSYLAEDELLFEQLLNQKRQKIIEKGKGYKFVEKEKLLLLSPLKAWVYYLLKPFSFSRSVSDDISASLTENKSGKNFFSGSHRLLIDRDKLIIIPNKPSEIESEFEIRESDIKLFSPLQLDISSYSKQDDFSISKGKNTGYFDMDKLMFPLILKKWETGDRFHPFGMKGSKLLSDYFVDEKLSLIEKENIWLVVSGKEIVWVVGMRTSDKFKITEQTKTVYRIALQ